jgi:hypothetical protein
VQILAAEWEAFNFAASIASVLLTVAAYGLLVWVTVTFVAPLVSWALALLGVHHLEVPHMAVAPWWFAFDVVTLRYGRELGRFALSSSRGYRPIWPMVVPLRATVTWPRRKPTPRDAACIWLAGGLAGLVGVVLMLVLYARTGRPSLEYVALFGSLPSLWDLVRVTNGDGRSVLRAVRSLPCAAAKVTIEGFSTRARRALGIGYVALVGVLLTTDAALLHAIWT